MYTVPNYYWYVKRDAAMRDTPQRFAVALPYIPYSSTYVHSSTHFVLDWIMGNEYKAKLDGRKGWDRRTDTHTKKGASPTPPKPVLRFTTLGQKLNPSWSGVT